MKALIVADMLNDFVSGPLARDGRARLIVPAVRRLIDHARADEDWLVVYANAAHRADDRETAIWGQYAMAGTLGAQVIDALAPIGAPREIVVPKRHFGAFDGTDLDDTLFDYEVSDVILVGQHTDRGLRYTAYGAFLAGLEIAVATDAVCATPGVEHQPALDDMKAAFGATIVTSTAMIGRPVLRTAVSNPAV